MAINTLALVEKRIVLPTVDTRTIKIRKHKPTVLIFDDFVVDGKVLSDLIKESEPSSPLLSTSLAQGWDKAEQIKSLKRLLGLEKPDLPGNRVAIYVCPFDGDLQCDCVGVDIVFNADTVVWKKFAWDGTHEDWSENDPYDEEESVTPLQSVNSFTFDKIEYEALMQSELKKLSVK